MNFPHTFRYPTLTVMFITATMIAFCREDGDAKGD